MVEERRGLREEHSRQVSPPGPLVRRRVRAIDAASNPTARQADLNQAAHIIRDGMDNPWQYGYFYVQRSIR